ncbi:hypothetical protein [Allosphingosinicella sp.]|jgi:2,4-dienoyl-CoA reductase-like NADH-dependent reductase (Old Yellow Enzyme family)|uniref:hypothetical protein n=1 Tax=Allosphingosinicella sp. TaxID=2823234 RepID=UPI002F002272
MCLLALVERYLKRQGIPPTKFGREVLGDPNFVRELRNGRDPTAATVARVGAFIALAERKCSKPPCEN